MACDTARAVVEMDLAVLPLSVLESLEAALRPIETLLEKIIAFSVSHRNWRDTQQVIISTFRDAFGRIDVAVGQALAFSLHSGKHLGQIAEREVAKQTQAVSDRIGALDELQNRTEAALTVLSDNVAHVTIKKYSKQFADTASNQEVEAAIWLKRTAGLAVSVVVIAVIHLIVVWGWATAFPLGASLPGVGTLRSKAVRREKATDSGTR